MTTPTSRPSGLRNPVAGARAVGATALGCQGLVLLLAIVPLNVLGRDPGGATTAALLGFAAASFVLCGLLRHRWAWYAGTALPVAIFVTGLFVHPALAVVGGMFCVIWGYAASVRNRLLRPPA
jgi:hypothetical protein